MASSGVEPDPEAALADAGDRRLAGNAAWMVAGQAVAKLSSFAFVLIVTRALDSAAYGHFNFAASFVPLFLIVGTWGLDIALIRDIARDRGRVSELVASALVIRVGLGLVAVAAAMAVGRLVVGGGTGYATLVVLAVALLLDEATNLVGSVFKAFERMAFFSLVLVVNRVATTLLALGAVMAGYGIVAVSAMYLLGSAGALAAAAVVLRTRFPPVRLGDARRSTVDQLLRHGAPLGLAAALNMALLRVDTVLLRAFDGVVAVGLYGAAYRFFDAFLFVAYGLGVVAMPRLARSHWAPDSERGFNGVLAVLLAFYVPLAVAGLFLSPWLITSVFGNEYAPAAPAVAWLTGAALLYSIAYLCRFSAVALGRRSQIATVAAATLAFNVAANLVVIPRYGFRGAAAVTFASEVLEAVLLAAVFRRAAGRVRLHALNLVPVLAGAVMFGVLVVIDRRDGLAAVAAVLAYGAALVIGGRLVAPEESRRALAMVRAR